MRLLLDTNCWLKWWIEPEALNRTALALMGDARNEIYFSAVSAWEIAIKAALGKLDLPEAPKHYVTSRLHEQALESLPVSVAHALQVHALPPHHRDPFDRLLIAQAQLEELPILTTDPIMTMYEVEVIWASPRRMKRAAPAKATSKKIPKTK